VGFLTATRDRSTIRNFTEPLALIGAITASGFRRFATYRQATVAALSTNIMFGFLRTYVLLAVAGGGVVAGYGGPQLLTYVWTGQGLLGVVMLWGWTDLSDRIRSGDIVTDLLRPIHPVVNYLAADLGRAGYAMIFRFLPPVLVGALFFDLYLPAEAITYPLFALSVLLAIVICFGCRYLVNATAYWLLDTRGVNQLWLFMSGLMSGLYFPIRFLPDWAAALLWFGTPGPSFLQAPMDVLIERDPLPMRLGMIGVQVLWAALVLWLCRVAQRRAERRLVIQGG
jgi:viologen exporter family transport system permease protein